jgi:hypothetical protein
VLALRSIVIFPFAWLVVLAALLLLWEYDLPEAWRELPGFPIWRSLLRMLARTAVLTPFAIMIHRWIVLGGRENSYWVTLTHARTVRFLGALFLLTLVKYLPSLVGEWLHRPVGEQMLYIFLPLMAFAMLWTRLCLGFPIIATDDDATLPFRESFYVTSGSSWRIFLVFFIIGAIDLTLSMLAEHMLDPTARATLWIGAGWTVKDTIIFAIYVAVASYLWRTRGDWSDRGSAVSAALTTSTIP